MNPSKGIPLKEPSSFEMDTPQVQTPEQPIAGQLVDAKGKTIDVPQAGVTVDGNSNLLAADGAPEVNAEAIQDSEIIQPGIEYDLTPEQARFKDTKEKMEDFPDWLNDTKNAAEAIDAIHDRLTNPNHPDFNEEDLESIKKLLNTPELSGLESSEAIKQLLGEKLNDIEQTIRDNLEARLGDSDIPPELLKEQEGKLTQYFKMALSSGAEWAQEGTETSSFSDIMRLFLDCGFDGGMYRGGRMGDIESGMDKDSGDYKAVELIKADPPKGLIKLINGTFGNEGNHQGIKHLKLDDNPGPAELVKAIKFFNDQSEDEGKWAEMQKGMSHAIDPNKTLNFSADIRQLFISLQSEKNLIKFIDLKEEAKQESPIAKPQVQSKTT